MRLKPSSAIVASLFKALNNGTHHAEFLMIRRNQKGTVFDSIIALSIQVRKNRRFKIGLLDLYPIRGDLVN